MVEERFREEDSRLAREVGRRKFLGGDIGVPHSGVRDVAKWMAIPTSDFQTCLGQCCEFGSFTVGDNALDPDLTSRALQLPTLQRWWFGSETTKTGGIAVVGALAREDASNGFGFQLRQTPGEPRDGDVVVTVADGGTTAYRIENGNPALPVPARDGGAVAAAVNDAELTIQGQRSNRGDSTKPVLSSGSSLPHVPPFGRWR